MITKGELAGHLAELREAWDELRESGLNVKAKKEAAARLGQKQDWVVEVVLKALETERSQAVAVELAAHAQHYWDMAAMYDRTRELAEKSGEEGAGLIAEATMQVCRDVAKRLKARAAEVRGVDPAQAALFADFAGAGGGGGEGGHGE